MPENTSSAETTSEEPIFKKPKLPVEKIKAPRLKHEDAYLRSIPSANQYEKSFMHRDTITHIVATKTDFIITASKDGHLKFWKKKHGEGVEFVKHFRCHLNEFVKLAVNHDGSLLATVCTEDKSIKVFDIVNFDMINMIQLDFSPSTITWVHQSSDVINALAVADANSPVIRILDGKGTNEPFHIIEGLHFKPVVLMEYNSDADIAVSIDEGSMIEFWSGSKNNFEFPAEDVDWDYKMETDFYEYLESVPRCLTLSPNGRTFATVGTDRILRIFDIKTGKLTKVLDESLQYYVEKGKENKNHGLPNMEWNRRIALEKELNRDPTAFRFMSVVYDFSSNFIIFPTPLGICVYNLVTDEVVRTIGKGENARFVGVALCRAVPDVREFLQGAATSMEIETAENPNLKRSEPDPMLIACAYKRHRFYIFTNAEPFSTDEEEDGQSNRDVFNEKPLKEETITAVEDSGPQSRLSTRAIIHTTYGDIHVELYPEKCPRAVENFCTHSRRGYYNGLSFHRVIRSFMIQTGDPTGKGTGGQSIWGHDFEDEFHPSLKYDKPYRLAMANAGANTNGSQFFITVVPAEWLDGKNTLFGQVTEGFNVVQKISNVNTHEKSGRPKDNISIVSISLKTE